MSPEGSIPLFRVRRIGSRNIMFVKRYDKNDTKTNYAHRSNLINLEKDIITECQKFDTIQVSIKAECPYYGTSFVTSKEYNKNEDILNSSYSFNTGDSLSCSSH